MFKRFLELRKALEMSQEDMGQRIGVTKSTISLIERGQRNASDRVIRDICREFRISEEWLRTGEGEMFNIIFEEDEYMKYATKLGQGKNEAIKAAIIKFGMLDEAKQKVINDFIESLGKKEE